MLLLFLLQEEILSRFFFFFINSYFQLVAEIHSLVPQNIGLKIDG